MSTITVRTTIGDLHGITKMTVTGYGHVEFTRGDGSKPTYIEHGRDTGFRHALLSPVSIRGFLLGTPPVDPRVEKIAKAKALLTEMGLVVEDLK